MNLNNYSFDDNYGKNNKKFKFKPVQIILMFFLLVFFLVLAFLYKGLKKNEDKKKNVDTATQTEEKNFVTELSTLDDLYGFAFTLSISGTDSNVDFLGDFIPTLFQTNDFIITGTIWKGGADIEIFEGTLEESYYSPTTPIYINPDGVFCSTQMWREFIYPDDLEKANSLPNTYVRIADGKRGEEIIQGICEYFEMSKSYKDITYSYTEDAKYQINIPANDIELMSGNSDFPILSSLKGDFSCSLNAYRDNDGLCNYEVIGGTDGLKLHFEAIEIQQYSKPPYVDYYITLDDYLTFLN